MDTLEGKKILFVITKSNWGGAQVYVHALANHLHKKGALVTVALGGTGTPGAETGLLAERLKESGIPVVVIPSFMRDISIDREFRALTELRAVIRKTQPDILHLNSPKAGGLGALAGRLEGVRSIIYTAHGWAHREPRNTLRNSLVWLASWVTILLCNRIIAVSEIDYRHAPTFLSRRKITVVRNGITPFPLLPRDSARADLAKIAPLPLDTTWLLIQAELHKNKGVSVAISAVESIRIAYPNVILVVLGEGEERAALTAQITKSDLTAQVFLLGFVSDSRTYLAAADSILIPSYKEGLPLALLEAGMAGLPTIASKTGGIPEIMEDQKNGLLVRPGDVTALATAMTVLLSDPLKAVQYGRELHTRIVNDFSEERMVEETIAVYTKK